MSLEVLRQTHIFSICRVLLHNISQRGNISLNNHLTHH